MERKQLSRRGFVGRLAAALGAFAAVPAMAGTAQAGWSHRRFGYGWGGRGWSHGRFGRGFGFGRGFFGPGYYGGYPGYYGGGYGGGFLGPNYYNRGYFGSPFMQPYSPYYGNGGGIYIPLNGPARRPANPLHLLET